MCTEKYVIENVIRGSSDFTTWLNSHVVKLAVAKTRRPSIEIHKFCDFNWPISSACSGSFMPREPGHQSTIHHLLKGTWYWIPTPECVIYMGYRCTFLGERARPAMANVQGSLKTAHVANAVCSAKKNKLCITMLDFAAQRIPMEESRHICIICNIYKYICDSYDSYGHMIVSWFP